MLGGQRSGDSRFSSGPRQVLGRSLPAPRSLSSLGACLHQALFPESPASLQVWPAGQGCVRGCV